MSHKFFTPPQPSPNPRFGSKKFTNDLGLLYRWQKANIWQQVLERLQPDADRQGKLDGEIHYVDGSVIRAHQHAASGKKGANHRRN